jgi:hypothetical protein
MFHGNSHVIALENVSEISDKLSDLICALNTGTGYAERLFLHQGVEFMTKLHCPVIINGIPGNLADRPDLADRSVTFSFEYLGQRSRSDDMLWRNFKAAAPKLFGVILNGIVGALKVRQQYGDDNDAAAEGLLGDYRPRYVDAVVWAEAACRAMGFAPGEFVEAYKDNRLSHKRWIADNNTVCVAIRKLIAEVGEWQGYPEGLVADLRPYTSGRPLSANWLTRRDLPNAIPLLRDLHGIHVTMNRRLEQNDNRNGIIIEGVSRGTHSEDSSSSEEAQEGTTEYLPLPTPIETLKRRKL